MGLDDVKKDILDEAKEEKERILEEAEEEKDEILEEAEKEAERIKSETEEEIEEEKEAIERKTVSNANMEAKKTKLEAKEKSLDSAFENFREELEDLDESQRKEMLERAIEDSDFTVGLVKGDESFESVTDLEFEASDVEGFILVSDDGERQLNYSLDKIIDDFRSKYRQDVAEKLFG